MHYAEFAEDEVSNFVRLTAVSEREVSVQLTLLQSAALLQAIKDYENNKWKVIGQKVGKPAKVCLFLCSREKIPSVQPQETDTFVCVCRPVNSSQRNKAGRSETRPVARAFGGVGTSLHAGAFGERYPFASAMR